MLPALALLFTLTAQDQAQAEPRPETEEPVEVIVVTGARTDEAVGTLPYATTTLDEVDIGRGRPTLSLAESLSQVPGLFVSAPSNFAQDTRISIRGFGARAPFGVRGIRIFLDGIPLTLPDGSSQIDSLDLANVGRIEVLRGPAASLYGNAAGGVIQVETKAPAPIPTFDIFNLNGAFETWKLAVGGRAEIDDTGVSVFASRTQTEGYRDQSGTEQVVAQMRTVSAIADNAQLSTIIHYVNAPRADDPGGLTPEQFRRTPKAAAEVNERFGTGESVSQLQAGSRLVVDLADDRHRFEATVHGGLRDFLNAIPFRTVDFTRDFFGGFLLYRWAEPGWLGGHRLALGLEAQGQEDRRGNQGNRNGRPNGEVELLQTERARSFGVFGQERLTVWGPLTLLGSVRYDRVELEVDDDFLADGDATGSRAFDQVTAQGGVVVQPASTWEVYANVAQAYETPTLGELVNAAPDGGLSSILDPQSALSFEAGARAMLPGLRAEVAGFLIDLEDELIPGEDRFNRTVFTNAGSSRRVGAEAWIELRPLPHTELTLAYTWLRATFEDDGPGEESRRGNLVPGLPEHRVFGRLRYDDGSLFATAEIEWVDARFADDANAIDAPAHTLAELRAGLHADLSAAWGADFSFGVRNLFDVRWVENVRPNAFGNRSFEPGPPLHVFGVLTVTYQPLDASP